MNKSKSQAIHNISVSSKHSHSKQDKQDSEYYVPSTKKAKANKS